MKRIVRNRIEARKRRNARRLDKDRFRTFLKYWMRVPCQVLTTGRRLVLRVQGWNKWQPEFFRLAASLASQLRC